jgi:hypothetical protein
MRIPVRIDGRRTLFTLASSDGCPGQDSDEALRVRRTRCACGTGRVLLVIVAEIVAADARGSGTSGLEMARGTCFARCRGATLGVHAGVAAFTLHLLTVPHADESAIALQRLLSDHQSALRECTPRLKALCFVPAFL